MPNYSFHLSEKETELITYLNELGKTDKLSSTVVAALRMKQDDELKDLEYYNKDLKRVEEYAEKVKKIIKRLENDIEKGNNMLTVDDEVREYRRKQRELNNGI